MKYKCIHCGKPESDHNASDRACPIGKKHRALGHMQYKNMNQI
jgi:DNA-directed RNA polymerase subunit RPC12/RpoP